MARYIDVDKVLECCHITTSSDDIIEALQEAPTADVEEVKHGEWICLEVEIGYFACSECDHRILRAECNYCPNCGAKMDGRSGA